MEKLKLALIGAGVWGRTHASIYTEHPMAELVAVCDRDQKRAGAIAAEFNIPHVYTDYREMLRKAPCEAVTIVTPDFAHAELAIACARAGKHMLIEKPFATTREDTFRMLEAIEAGGVRVMVDFHNRWSPPFHSAKQVLDEGGLGRPVSVYFRLNDVKWVATHMLPWAARSSILWFLGSHSLETTRWLLDSEPAEIYAVKSEGVLKGLGVDAADQYLSTIKFKNGSIAQMENGWITPNGNPCINDIKCTVLCEKGKIEVDASSHGMIDVVTEEKVLCRDVLVSNFIFNRCKGFAYESIRSFVDCMVTGEPFQVSLRDAVNTTLGLLGVMESADTGRIVTPELI